ncbi:hypothetical protein M3Y95_01231200 [Aphelenchoides besseyi]|nr:hypothetical protein M3Y95_01231200 [Aphelenchoides besseyi]
MSSTVLFSFRSWWPIFLAVLLVSSPLYASAEGDCFTSDGKEVKLSAKCTKANTTIKVSSKDQVLGFQLIHVDGGNVNAESITLTVGGCVIQGAVSYGGARDSFQLDDTANPKFPARAKATSSGVIFENPKYSVPSCTPKFVADGDGNLVNITYEGKAELPNLQITFSSSQLYVPPEEKVDWSTGGWRLWTVIAAVIAVVLIILSIITFFVIKRCKNKNQKTDAKKTTKKKSPTTKSASTKKNNTKKAKKSDEKKAKKSNEKKAEAKEPYIEDWIQIYRWPKKFTENEKNYLRAHLQGPSAPVRKLFEVQPMEDVEHEALNEWVREHLNLLERWDDLSYGKKRQVQADNDMFKLMSAALRQLHVEDQNLYEG